MEITKSPRVFLQNWGCQHCLYHWPGTPRYQRGMNNDSMNWGMGILIDLDSKIGDSLCHCSMFLGSTQAAFEWPEFFGSGKIPRIPGRHNDYIHWIDPWLVAWLPVAADSIPSWGGRTTPYFQWTKAVAQGKNIGVIKVNTPRYGGAGQTLSRVLAVKGMTRRGVCKVGIWWWSVG